MLLHKDIAIPGYSLLGNLKTTQKPSEAPPLIIAMAKPSICQLRGASALPGRIFLIILIATEAIFAVAPLQASGRDMEPKRLYYIVKILSPGSSGSGVIIKKSNHVYKVLTSKHVTDIMAKGEALTIMTWDGKTRPATAITQSPS